MHTLSPISLAISIRLRTRSTYMLYVDQTTVSRKKRERTQPDSQPASGEREARERKRKEKNREKKGATRKERKGKEHQDWLKRI